MIEKHILVEFHTCLRLPIQVLGSHTGHITSFLHRMFVVYGIPTVRDPPESYITAHTEDPDSRGPSVLFSNVPHNTEMQ